ncbi:MAG TPA: cupredoxin domain-containing protein [Candidatus Saccharimonadales bacterium]
MGKAGKIIVAVLIVAIIALVAVMMNKNKSTETIPNDTSGSSNQQNNNQASGNDAAATITFNGNDFSLSSNRIKSGDKVKIVNTSSTDLEFDSDPHPVHTNNKELNVDLVKPGESKTFTITKKGTWGFHNHLKSSQTGSITVE